MLPAEHRDTRRLQVLQGSREVEERLRARAYRDDGMAGERVEVRGDVTGQRGAAVHAADAAGGEDLDAGGVGQRHRGRDGAGDLDRVLAGFLSAVGQGLYSSSVAGGVDTGNPVPGRGAGREQDGT